MSPKKSIPNPNKLSSQEINFLTDKEIKVRTSSRNRFKGRMISMSDDFYSELNEYLQDNPTEGNRSSFIVRVVADYIKDKKSY